MNYYVENDKEMWSCVMANFTAIFMSYQHSAKELRRAGKQIGEVFSMQELYEYGGCGPEENVRRCGVNSAMRELRLRLYRR